MLGKKRLTTTNAKEEADRIRGLLEAAGIECICELFGNQTRSLGTRLDGGLSDMAASHPTEYTICVRKKDYDRAEEVLGLRIL